MKHFSAVILTLYLDQSALQLILHFFDDLFLLLSYRYFFLFFLLILLFFNFLFFQDIYGKGLVKRCIDHGLWL